ncbi:MAG: glycoside hydrolase family 55 protein, partial [Bacteroidales bacterium]|nr:glycoside hydrolase family 55 protein [Bacteroidales bacterium]
MDGMTGAAQFNTTVFRSASHTVKPSEPGNFTASQVTFHECDFNGPAHLSGLMSTIANSDFSFTGDHVTLDNSMQNVILMDNRYDGERTIVNNMNNGNALVRDTSKVYASTPDFTYVPFISHEPSRAALYIVTDFTGVTRGDDLDDGPGIQLALDQAADDGGGIVFVPAGEYVLNTSINVPPNVELRGVLDMPHHGKLPLNRDLVHEFGSFFYVNHGNGSSDGATINVSSNAGVRGITAYYPEQDFYVDGVARPFPWLFGLKGENIYIQNVCAVNPYQLMDIASARCDNHYIENIYSMPLLYGIDVGGGSKGGRMRSVHYNGTMLLQAFYPGNREKLDVWSYPNTEAFRFGNTVDQEMLFCFGRLCRAGIVLYEQDGIGPNGLSIGFGIEDITQGACLDVQANNGFSFINASLLSESGTVFMNTT